MEHNRYNNFLKVALLTLLVMVSTVFVGAVTYAGDPVTPDATVTYTRNKLTWDVPTDANGVADLNLFGPPMEGEELPLIHPYSGDTYWLRLKNDVPGRIGYNLYLYTDEPSDIPLKFDVPKTEEIVESTIIPAELEGKQIISARSGKIEGGKLTNIEINWYWYSKSDKADTLLGDEAVLHDLIYTIRVLIVIEDNNTYHNSWGGSGVKLMHRSYVFGYPDDTFRPEASMTRAEVAAIFARLKVNYDESLLAEIETGFSDVESNAWHAKYIAALKDSKLIKGYPDGTFRPNAPITRAELATICVRYYEATAGKISGASEDFPDVPYFHWARKYIAKAVKQGLVEGYPDGTFHPDHPITRAEVITMVNRMLSRYPDEEHIDNNLDKLIHFTDVTDNTYWAYYQIYEAANDHYTRLTEKTESWQKLR